MTDFNNDDGWKMASSHNVKSVEDFLSDTAPIQDSEIILDEESNLLEDQLKDWGVMIPEVIDGGDEAVSHPNKDQVHNSSDEDEKGSIFDHLGTGIVEGENSDNVSFPESVELEYPDDLLVEVEESTEENPLRRQEDLMSEQESTGRVEVEVAPIQEALSEIEVTSVDDPSLPADSDLEYPDLEAIISETKDLLDSNADESITDPEATESTFGISESKSLPDDYEPRSKLIGLEELNNDLNSMQNDVDTDPSFEITREIKGSLADEISTDVSSEDFWATDDFPSISSKLDETRKESDANIKESFFKDVLTDESDEDDSQFKMRPSNKLASINVSDLTNEKIDNSVPMSDVNIDEVVDRVKEAIEPVLEKIVKELFSKKIEEVAWEVIPDLAENVIKKEVEEIAKQVYLSTNDSVDKK